MSDNVLDDSFASEESESISSEKEKEDKDEMDPTVVEEMQVAVDKLREAIELSKSLSVANDENRRILGGDSTLNKNLNDKENTIENENENTNEKVEKMELMRKSGNIGHFSDEEVEVEKKGLFGKQGHLIDRKKENGDFLSPEGRSSRGSPTFGNSSDGSDNDNVVMFGNRKSRSRGSDSDSDNEGIKGKNLGTEKEKEVEKEVEGKEDKGEDEVEEEDEDMNVIWRDHIK